MGAGGAVTSAVAEDVAQQGDEDPGPSSSPRPFTRRTARAAIAVAAAVPFPLTAAAFPEEVPSPPKKAGGDGDQEEDAEQPAINIVDGGDDDHTPPPPPGAPSSRAQEELTPYDNILGMLRNGPLNKDGPRSFARPRSRQEPSPSPAVAITDAAEAVVVVSDAHDDEDDNGKAGRGDSRRASEPIVIMHHNPAFDRRDATRVDAETPGSTLPGPGPGPSAQPSQQRQLFGAYSAGRRTRFAGGHRRVYAGSRLGPYGGGFGAATSYGTSVFGLTGRGAAAPAVVPQTVPSVAATITASSTGEQIGRGTSTFVSPAWTPMSSITPLRPMSAAVGEKRKAEEDAALAGSTAPSSSLGSISLLDAQRRIRQKSEPAMSAGRRSWRAGFTPYKISSATKIPRYGTDMGGGVSTVDRRRVGMSGTGIGRGLETTPVFSFGGAARPASLSPPPLGGMPASSLSGSALRGDGGRVPGSKPTTDTARKILESLDRLDEAMRPRKSPGEGRTPGSTPAPPVAPPAESLGGRVSSGPAVGSVHGSTGINELSSKKRKPRVTFAELTGAQADISSSVEKKAEDRSTPPVFSFTSATPSSIPIVDKTQQPPGSDALPLPIAVASPIVQAPPSHVPSPPLPAPGVDAMSPPSLPPFGFGAAMQNAKKDVKKDTRVAAAVAVASNSEAKVYTFGATPKEESHKVKNAIAALVAVEKTSPGSNIGNLPLYSFGKGKKEKKADGNVAPPAAQPFFAFAQKDVEQQQQETRPLYGTPRATQTEHIVNLAAANKVAQEAAKSPLPAIESDAEEEVLIIDEKKAILEEKKDDAPPSSSNSGGWDLSFLQKNKAQAVQATDAAAQEIESKNKPPAVATTAAVGKFSFGLSTTTTTAPAPTFNFGTTATASTAEVASTVTAAAFPEPASMPAFLMPTTSAPPKMATAPPVFGFGSATTTTATTALPPVFGFGASTSTAVEKESEETKKPEEQPKEKTPCAPAATNSGGWGDAFLKANQQAAATAADAAAKEAEKGSAAPAPPASTTPAFSFGLPSTMPTASTTPPATAAAPIAGALGFGFGATTPAATQTAPAPTFAFGASPAKVDSTSTGGAPKAPSTAFAFGATPLPSTDAAPSTASSAPFAVTSASAAAFSFGAAPSSFAIGGSSSRPHTESAPAAPAPAAPTSAFGFGSTASQPSSAFAFGASTQQEQQMAAAPSTFAFGAAPSSTPAAAPGSIAAPSPVIGFGLSSTTATPSTAFTFGSGAATAASAAAPTAPVFGGGSAFGVASAPVFGSQQQQQPSAAAPPVFGSSGGGSFGAPAFGAQSAPTTMPFGAPQQHAQQASAPPVFGGAAPSSGGFGGVGFGSGMSAPQPFPSAQPTMGAMIPNNPFGSMPAGGFNMGSSGNSQSEGRRKLKVRRPGRK